MHINIYRLHLGLEQFRALIPVYGSVDGGKTFKKKKKALEHLWESKGN